MLESTDAIYPMFATHNAHTIASVQQMAKLVFGTGAATSGGHRFEFQKLHGLGDDLYAEVMPADRLAVACRVHAPAGSHQDLPPYQRRTEGRPGGQTSAGK